MTMEDLPPQVRLGVRAEGVRRAWPVAPVVVLVPDEGSYLRAVEGWTLKSRYPVLIDDGSAAAREDIGRFVRAFAPERVVRWAAREAGGTPAPLPGDGPARQAMIEAAVRKVWAQVSPVSPPKDQAGQIEAWVKTGVPPPGVVVADDADPAWPAALALSVGRAQPIVWIKTDRGVSGAYEPLRFGHLAEAVEAGTEKLGLTWRGLGDQVDAVTLCLNSPSKVKASGSAGEVLATTDLVGRLAKEAGGTPAPQGLQSNPRELGERWAWAGQVFGDGPRSAYMAMCALFLSPRSAWVFDGYESADPWGQFDGTAAGEHLRKAGLEVVVEDEPRQGERQWRVQTAGGLGAGLVLVNTHGMGDQFNLRPGVCRSGDVPMLRVPAAVHFVHS
ncbi:MAG: hypothetical protein WD749_15020, partial [Phycisphaerales bacterium]